MSQIYQATDPNGLIRHELDSMTLIFQKSSGITHMVADPVPAILEAMGRVAQSASDIAKKLSENYDLEQGMDVEDIVFARLEELRELGLVERL